MEGGSGLQALDLWAKDIMAEGFCIRPGWIESTRLVLGSVPGTLEQWKWANGFCEEANRSMAMASAKDAVGRHFPGTEILTVDPSFGLNAVLAQTD